MVNGAGLAMATMDTIDMLRIKGGSPPNFLDIGGSASPEQIGKILDFLLTQKNAKSVFLNEFAGILRCDVIAQSLVKFLENRSNSVPIVVRFQGNKVTEAKKRLEGENLEFVRFEADMESAAQMSVDLAS